MGYLFVIMASVCFGIAPNLSTVLQRSGWSPAAVLAVSNLVGAVLLLAIIKVKGLSLRLRRDQIPPLLVFGAGGFLLTTLLLQLAYRHMLTGLCTMIHFIYPVVVMVVMILLFKEKITGSKVLCMVMALVGIFLIVGLSNSPVDGNIPLGAALAAASGVAYASFVVGSGKTSMAELNSFVSTFYIQVCGVVVMGLWMLLSGGVATITFSGLNALMVPLYPFFNVMGVVTLARGIRIIGATRSAIINMLEPAVSMLVSILLFGGSDVTAFALLGCALILAAVVIVTLEKKSARV